MKEKIAWKVVSKERTSCSISYYTKKYFRIYTEGEIVTAVPNSLGIFCFKTRQNARDFIQWLGTSKGYYKVLKVNPLSEGIQPKVICSSRWEGDLDKFYLDVGSKYLRVPKGTICYQSIQVLD